VIRPKERRAGFLSSARASYTPQDLAEIVLRTDLAGAQVRGMNIVLAASGSKAA
jgi:hypothetical protein